LKIILLPALFFSTFHISIKGKKFPLIGHGAHRKRKGKQRGHTDRRQQCDILILLTRINENAPMDTQKAK
jgi:hypothetical protein